MLRSQARVCAMRFGALGEWRSEGFAGRCADYTMYCIT